MLALVWRHMVQCVEELNLNIVTAIELTIQNLHGAYIELEISTLCMFTKLALKPSLLCILLHYRSN